MTNDGVRNTNTDTFHEHEHEHGHEHETRTPSSNAVCRPPSSVPIITDTRVKLKAQSWESLESWKNEL